MVASRVRRVAAWDVLGLSAAIWFLGKFLRYVFPPLFETIGGTYDVSLTALGSAFTGFLVVYALMQFPSGLLADRFGPVRVIAGGVLLTSAGAFAIVADAPFLVLAGAMVAMGAGTGAYKTVSVGLLSRVYPARTGRALGVFDTFGSMAGVAAPAAVVAVAGLPAVLGAPWRTVFLAGGLAGLGLVVAFVRRVPLRLDGGSDGGADAGAATASDAEAATASDAEAATASDAGGTTAADAAAGEGVRVAGERVPGDGPGGVRRYAGLFSRWRFSAFVGVTVLFGFAYNSVIAFLPLYLAAEAGLSSATANLLYGALFAVSVVQVVTGEASDRVGLLPVLVVTVGLATAGLGALLLLSGGDGAVGGPFGGTGVLGAAVVTLGLGAHGYRPLRSAYLIELLPDDVAGGGLGAVRTILMGAGAVGPAIVGYLSETAGFRTAFGLLALAFLGALALTAVLWVLE